MGRYKQTSDSKGSLKDIQNLINNNSDLLNAKIKSILNFTEDIIWKSPLKDDEYAEYRDQDFIDRLDISLKIRNPLEKFWPSMGPQWDALGKTPDKVFLIEAKAHIPEIISPPCQAGEISLNKIQCALYEVKDYLGVNNSIDWSSTFYQYTNRIAHLYFFNVLNDIDAYLLNIYFVNDQSVKGPINESEWKGALCLLKQYLGIPNNKLTNKIIDIFIDINDMRM